MGQKTHPTGFRLITTQKHLSNWYSTKGNYSTLIEEDYFIRQKIESTYNDFLSISKIEIDRITKETNTQEYVNVTIHALFPREKEMSRKLLKHFPETVANPALMKGGLKKITTFFLKTLIRNTIRFFQKKTNKNVSLTIHFIKNPFEDATLIAKFIAEQLEKRTPFRRAIKQTIKKVKRTDIQGIKVQVSGRLNGIDIARSEWKRNGKIPLHTLNAKMDYTHQKAETIYGLIGIKIWLFKGFEQ